MKNGTLRVGNGTLRPDADPVKQKIGVSPTYSRASEQVAPPSGLQEVGEHAEKDHLPGPWRAEPGTWKRPDAPEEPDPRNLPPSVMLGVLVLDQLYREALGHSFYSACSLLEGVHELTRHHPDLRAYNDALAGIVAGEQAFIHFYSSLGGLDPAIEAALEEPLTHAAELLGVCLRRLVDAGAASPVHLKAHDQLVAGLGTLEQLRSYLDAL